MKKTIIAILLSLLLMDIKTVDAIAMWDTPRSTVQNHQLIFLKVRDEYQLRYAIGGLPTGTVKARANFWAASGMYYEVVFDQPTGIAYLTCNGTYIFELLDASGNTIAETEKIITHKIVNPACRSYENTGLKNDMNGKVEQRPEGGASIEWDIQPNTHKYEIYKDGELWHQFLESSNQGKQTMAIFPNGAYSIFALDENGQYLGSFDFLIGGADEGLNNGGNKDGGDNGNDKTCYDGCQWITDALNCPAWDDYMGEWKSMLQEVYQPPNWQEVANVMRDTIVPAIGNELLQKSPQIAEIFADEFTSREKPVAPPPTTPPNYEPPSDLPQLEDLPQEINFDLSNDIPTFEPDYSESQPFNIPNPFDLQLSDDDYGYTFQQNIETDIKEYEWAPIGGGEGEIPTYNAPPSEDMPSYNTPIQNEMPSYNAGTNDDVIYYDNPSTTQ